MLFELYQDVDVISSNSVVINCLVNVHFFKGEMIIVT